jgi:hypothetical protein
MMMIGAYGALVELQLVEELKYFYQKLVPVSLRPPQVPHGTELGLMVRNVH